MMTPQSTTSRKRKFTVEEANATLPLVRAIVEDLVALSGEVFERRERLAALGRGRQRDPDDPYHQELAQMEEELEDDTRRLRGYVEELLELGVEPKSATQGLVDFPAVIDGRDVYLCWQLGEPEVLYWHDREAGFQGRQPLTAEAAAEGSGIAEGSAGD
jgi:hypothetical protein